MRLNRLVDGQGASIPADRRIATIAERQHGALSRRQLYAAGLKRGAIESRIERGQLHRIHRGVYAVGQPRLTVAGRRMAAVLACGDAAVLSYRTAADIWGLRPSNESIVDVTIASRAGRKRRRGIRLHRGSLRPGETTRHDGLPLTTPARTLLDLASVVTGRALERAIDEAVRLDRLQLGTLDAVLHAHPNLAGRSKLVAVLDEHLPGSTLTRSPLEDRFLDLCRATGLPQPEVNVPLGPYVVDFLWRDQRLVVETDGRASHATLRAFEDDRTRDAYLTVHGFRVVRYTHKRIEREARRIFLELSGLLGPVTPGDWAVSAGRAPGRRAPSAGSRTA